MPLPVVLSEVVDALQMIDDMFTTYINRKTGEVIQIGQDEASLAEEEEPLDDLPDWQRELVQDARRVFESDDFITLPGRFEVHEWSIMERFAQSRDDPDVQDDLLDAIQGRGAFRNFKTRIERLGVREEWFRFRDEVLAEIAIEFLVKNGIPYRRDERIRKTEQKAAPRVEEEDDPSAADGRFFAALVRGNVEKLNPMLADDFILIDVLSGSEIGKLALLTAIKSGELVFDAIELLDSLVRRYQTTAVITGSTRMSARFGPTPFTVDSRYTHVYVQHQGRWCLVSAQGTQISAQTDATERASSGPSPQAANKPRGRGAKHR
jgi:hypothetical protein